MEFFNQAVTVLQTLVIALVPVLVSGVSSTFWKATATITLVRMLMCHKVTHRNLIDSNPTIPFEIIMKLTSLYLDKFIFE